MSDSRPVSPKVMLAMAITTVLGGGAGYVLDGVMHSTATPNLKTISKALHTASHGELAFVRILPTPPKAKIPSGVIPIQTRVTLSPSSPGFAAENQPALVWTAYRDGKFVFFPGSAFNAKGTNLSIPLIRAMELSAKGADTGAGSAITAPEQEAPGPQAENSSMATVMNAPGFIWAASGQQDEKPDIVLFVDPNCIFCHKQFDQLKPLVNAGKLVVKVVPVAFLKASSMGKAEAVLNGGMSAFLENEHAFNSSTEEGGISPLNDPNLSQEVQSNTRLMSKLEGGRIATPFMLVRQNSGGQESWQPHMGLVTGAQLPAMMGQ